MTKPPNSSQVKAALRFYENMGQQSVKSDQAKVIDAKGRKLKPCHRAIARRLLRQGLAVVDSRKPFTIRLLREVQNAPPRNH